MYMAAGFEVLWVSEGSTKSYAGNKQVGVRQRFVTNRAITRAMDAIPAPGCAGLGSRPSVGSQTDKQSTCVKVQYY